MKLLSVLLATLPLASAWRMRLYADANYHNIVEDLSGTETTPCLKLPAKYDNTVSSMKWQAYSTVWGYCTMTLFNDAACGRDAIISSMGDMNIKDFKVIWPGQPDANHDNQVSSWRVECRGAIGK